MNKEKEIAKGLHLMLERKETGLAKDMQAEIIGKLLLEAKEHSITKTLLHLLDLYFEDIAKGNQIQIRSNRGVIYDTDNDRC